MSSVPTTTLGFGRFFGDPAARRDLSGFSLARIEASRSPTEVPEHVHETAHLVLVLSGRYITTGEALEPGRGPFLVWNPPGTVHRDRFEEDAGTFFTVSVSDARLASLGSGALPERAVAVSSGAAVRAARRLARAFDVPPRRATFTAESLCHDLLSGFFEEELRRLGPPAWLRLVRETLERRYDERLRVEVLAERAGVHPVHLIRSFHRFFGRTPGQFLRERRVEAAATLLRATDRPVADIALETGFADQSHFTRGFGRVMGVAPAAFRRRSRSGLISDKKAAAAAR